MSGYGHFAYVYDRLTQNVEYPKRADYIASLLAEFGVQGGILLDAACGTGAMSMQFAKKGFDVIGVDASADMLMQAQAKKYDSGLDILYLNQDVRRLDLYGTVDCAVCCLDSVNHLATEQDVGAAFASVGFFMEKDGVFIFDVNTAYKHRHVLADNTFVYDLGDVYCVWQNHFFDTDCHVDVHLDIFEADGEQYDRYEEDISEFYYDDACLTALLRQAHFRVEARLGEMRRTAPTAREERVYYVCRKLKDQ